jgi:hypothetical protein
MDRVKRSGDAGKPDTAPASQVLKEVRAATQGDKVAVGDVLDGAGARVYGLALLLFALPEALPLPIVGLTAVVAIPLAIVSVWLILFGTGRRLPGWIRRRTIKRSWLEAGISKATGWLEWLETFSRPRMAEWTDLGRLFGVICLLLTFMLALPIPFGNIGPALCIAGIGFGILQRDGAVVAASLALSGLTLVGMSVAIYVIGWAALDVTVGLFI